MDLPHDRNLCGSIRSRHNRAWALYLLGRFDEADREIRMVAEAYERRSGPEYSIVPAARQLLSRTRAAHGRMEEGAALMTDVAERWDRELGPERPFAVASQILLDACWPGRRQP
ncbi:hypothetical protein [Streptomyces werraensis]|uniref:hypothetical protein n=1 Tax=Streptomyces werraensis TaxID=68284 RepID=UPI001CE2FB79